MSRRQIQQVDFIGSFPIAPPENHLPEVAFVGRSNVGKSSAINAMLNRKKSARVSQRPGRTQSINLFELDKTLRFVDLPGYGFAKVPLKVRQNWTRMIDKYLLERAQLKLVIVLVDSRHPAQKLDLTMLRNLMDNDIRFQVVATKSDCLPRSKKKNQQRKLAAGLGLSNSKLISFSSHAKEGLDELWAVINKFTGV